jgi:N-sulfoglucosamine sulfohydrolase
MKGFPMKTSRPNILFAFADDYGRYASCYKGLPGANSLCEFVDTPHIDRIAQEGVLFANAHVPAPSCTPCRSSVLSGRYFWQTRLGAILAGAVFDDTIPTYPLLLRDYGYDIGFTYKVWGPGVALDDTYAGKRDRYVRQGTDFNNFSFFAWENMNRGDDCETAKKPLYEEVRGNFVDFLNARQEGKPFCYWWGPTNTHRKWQKGSGKRLWDIDPDSLKGKMPAFFPDVHEVREDVADYLGECMAYDRGLGVLIEELEKRGELDNTLVVASGDHGIPGFPRAKCNLYDIGSEVTLAARLPGTIPAGRVIENMVNIMSLAPTFLEMGGCDRPEGMVAESLVPLLTTSDEGLIQGKDNFVVTGRERHVGHARQWNLPYPTRAIRTPEYTYIRNFKPDRWPMGDPKGMDDLTAPPIAWEALQEDTYAAYPDFDSSPTKAWMVHHRAEEEQRENYRLGFDKRPQEELFHNTKDPDQMNNLANDPTCDRIRKELEDTLFRVLRKQNDPRVVEEECRFEHSPYTDLKLNGEAYKESIAISKLRLEQS